MIVMEETSEIRDYIIKNRDIFMDVQNTSRNNSGNFRQGTHTILNYPKILDQMLEYVRGFRSYRKGGNDIHKRELLENTYGFYNGMFEKDKWRKKIALSEFNEMNYKFIERSKELNAFLKELKRSVDTQTLQIAKVTERQYKKLAKVNHDDMLIYLWLTKNQSINSDLKAFYNDPTTPVMHKALSNK